MEKYMTLLNKDHPVLELLYDDEIHAVTKIMDIYDLHHAPPAILDSKGIPNRRFLNEWLKNRAIPASRQHLAGDFPYLDDPLSLPEQNMGLSLSDRYWITDEPEKHKWADVNFFDNPFTEDLGLITLGERQQSPDASENLYSPNSTLNGDLQKKWTIEDGRRILLKSGSGPFFQEPYNEAVASLLHESLLEKEDFVPYWLHGRYCACPNMLREDEELVPMYDLLKNHKRPNHLSDYSFCLKLCEEHGIPSKQAGMHFEKMLTCDFILANHDRHYRNFGLIRNAETAEYVRMAPIYDTGSCLWHNAITLERYADYAYTAKPFGQNGMRPEKQLELFDGFQWFDESKLKGFIEKTDEILSKNKLLSGQRKDAILKGLKRNMDYAADYVKKTHNNF